jgi:hypothetical protein
MQDKPDPTDLVVTVAKFLRGELLPTLTGHLEFQLRVSINALELVARQLSLEPAANATEIERLTALLGHGGDLSALNGELCATIAAGRATLDTPGLAEHLWATTMDKLAVDQPAYASYRRELSLLPTPQQ